jgi:hypothetical protein
VAFEIERERGETERERACQRNDLLQHRLVRKDRQKQQRMDFVLDFLNFFRLMTTSSRRAQRYEELGYLMTKIMSGNSVCAYSQAA